MIDKMIQNDKYHPIYQSIDVEYGKYVTDIHIIYMSDDICRRLE